MRKAEFPLPKGWVLACPMNCGWKMYPFIFGGIKGYECAGEEPLGKLPQCGHFIDLKVAEDLTGLQMVED